MTVDSANKRIKQLNAEKDRILAEERTSYTYGYLAGEEPYIPTYSFTETQATIREIEMEIMDLKHRVNVFNTTHTVPGTEMTVDQALVLMPMLTAYKNKLEAMCSIPERVRKASYSSSVSEFTARNFDVKEVEQQLNETCDMLTRLQQGVSTLNLTEEI